MVERYSRVQSPVSAGEAKPGVSQTSAQAEVLEGGYSSPGLDVQGRLAASHSV